MADIIQTFPAGAGSGHTILDTNGTAVAQEKNLQFNGLSVTDDPTNGVTNIEGEGLNQDSLDDIAGASTLVPAVIIGDSNNYSTNEKVIGKWIDGKPIYQKTWTGLDIQTAYNVWTNIVAISNLDKLVSCSCLTSNNVIPTGLEFFYNDGYLKVESSISINLRKISILTVQYTKTTD